jgi:ParB-like chromosome segregation protein Spo0J
MKTLGEFKIHPLANKLPMMNAKEFGELKASIKLHGLLNPIITDHQERIIDGRNRLKACIETETAPRFYYPQ